MVFLSKNNQIAGNSNFERVFHGNLKGILNYFQKLLLDETPRKLWIMLFILTQLFRPTKSCLMCSISMDQKILLIYEIVFCFLRSICELTSCHGSLSVPPRKIRKLLKGTRGRKRVNLTRKPLLIWKQTFLLTFFTWTLSWFFWRLASDKGTSF